VLLSGVAKGSRSRELRSSARQGSTGASRREGTASPCGNPTRHSNSPTPPPSGEAILSLRWGPGDRPRLVPVNPIANPSPHRKNRTSPKFRSFREKAGICGEGRAGKALGCWGAGANGRVVEQSSSSGPSVVDSQQNDRDPYRTWPKNKNPRRPSSGRSRLRPFPQTSGKSSRIRPLRSLPPRPSPVHLSVRRGRGAKTAPPDRSTRHLPARPTPTHPIPTASKFRSRSKRDHPPRTPSPTPSSHKRPRPRGVTPPTSRSSAPSRGTRFHKIPTPPVPLSPRLSHPASPPHPNHHPSLTQTKEKGFLGKY
jgi:hypothetical protein